MSRSGKQKSAELDTTSLPPLPKGWCWTTVEHVGHVQLGRQRSPKNRSDKYPTKYIRAANLTWQGLSLDDVLDMDFKPTEREAYTLRLGDILLSEASGSADEVGKPAIWTGEIPNCCFQNTVIRFRPCGIPADFPFIAFLHFARNGLFAQAAKGIGIHHLGAERFAQMPLPLPPLREQQRIKTKVDELLSDLDAGVAALKRVQANLKRYRAAVLKAAVEGRLTAEWRKKSPPTETGSQLLARILAERRRKWEEAQLAAFAKAEKSPPPKWKDKYKEPAGVRDAGLPALPDGWCWASIEQVTENFDGRRIPIKSKDRDKRPGPYPYYGASGAIDDIDDYLFDGRFLLVAEDGANLLSRSTPIAFQVSGKFWVNNHAHVLSTIGDVPLSFLNIFLNSISLTFHVSGSAQPKLTQAALNRIIVPLPPLPEQNAIVDDVDRRLSITKEIGTLLHSNLRRAIRLRQAILKRAFEGRLVPQDPTDEPAAALLERIRVEKENGKTKPARKTK